MPLDWPCVQVSITWPLHGLFLMDFEGNFAKETLAEPGAQPVAQPMEG